MLIPYLRQLLKPKYQTLNRIEIDGTAIKNNLEYLQLIQPQANLIPVLKSNAYGHGLKEMCRILNKTDVKMVAVDSFPEAQIAARYFKRRILLLGEMPAAAYRHLPWSRTEVCVYNGATLRAVADLGVKAKIHLFVNTGMNREGIKDLPAFWTEHKQYWSQVEIKGLCSHLADAEGDGSKNKEQQKSFFSDLDFLNGQGCQPEWVHLGNSAGVFVLNDKRLTAFRPGIAVYGYNPFAENSPYYVQAQKLQPALRLISTVVSVQKLEAGESVSYNAAYRSTEPTQIAVIPFGYYEGLDRRLSNLACFQLMAGNNKIKVSLAGNVCMNLCCLNIGREAAAVIGSEVILVSPVKSDYNSLENLAKLQNSIPYELLVKFQANIRRKII